MQFRVSTSVVAVCGFCQQVVARGDVDVADLGKSNPVLQVPSAFAVGTVGRFRDLGFTVVGRAQLKHALGGVWNEWYAALDNGRWVWIAEHQGRVAFLGEVSTTQGPGIRTLAAAKPGSRWLSGRGEFVVAERGIATVHAQEGELPWRAAPNERRAAVDLQAPGGVFGTLDLGTVGADEQPQGPIRFFVGHEVDVASLGLSHPSGGPPTPDEAPQQVVGTIALSCPSCQAPLTLKRPDDSRTIVCDHCGSASSVDEHKKLALLFPQKLRFEPKIPIGSRARLDGKVLANARPQDDLKDLDVEVVAFVVRSVIEDGEKYTFDEYLLATPTRGFFWLVESDGQWLFYRPINAADVVEQAGAAQLQGKRYKLEGRSMPTVEQVMGELYWQVRLGDTSKATDYRLFAFRLTVEKTTDEVNWTFGFAVPRGELARAFGVRLPITTAAASGGSPFASAHDASSGGRSSSTNEPPLVVQALVFMFILFVVFASECDDDDDGGGHGSYGGGGGVSFGK